MQSQAISIHDIDYINIHGQLLVSIPITNILPDQIIMYTIDMFVWQFVKKLGIHN